jgi:moderate conductance mechanosensitive channel
MESFFAANPLFILLLGLVLCLLMHWLIGKAHRRFARVDRANESSSASPDSLRRLYLEWAAKALRALVWIVFFGFALQLVPAWQSDLQKARDALHHLLVNTGDWLLGKGLSAVIVLLVTIFLMRFVAALVHTTSQLYEQRFATYQDEHVKRRAQTISLIFRGLAQAVVFFVGLMVALQQGGLNITPILASAGIVGLAIGFGAQSLIKDLFAGLMILFEEQYSVGDTIKIGDVTGIVEALTLRSTRVRGSDGALTIFPNGGISTVANLSKDWLRVVLDFEVDYAADVDVAMKTMGEVAAQLKAERPGEILEEPVMQGVEKVVGAILTLRLVVKTIPTKQAEISRELRRRVKLAFDQAGISAPGKVTP